MEFSCSHRDILINKVHLSILAISNFSKSKHFFNTSYSTKTKKKGKIIDFYKEKYIKYTEPKQKYIEELGILPVGDLVF